MLAKFHAIKNCPTAAAGTDFEAEYDAGMVLVSVGAARLIEAAPKTVVPAPAVTPRSRSNRYNRRDLVAEDTSDLRADETIE